MCHLLCGGFFLSLFPRLPFNYAIIKSGQRDKNKTLRVLFLRKNKGPLCEARRGRTKDRKSTRLNSSHVRISYAVFCLKKKTHIKLADGADVVLIAPATANLLAKLAPGLAAHLLTTALLPTRAPVVVAPPINVHICEHP